jgi:hypothetical protein
MTRAVNLRSVASLAFVVALAAAATVGCARPEPRSVVNADTAVATTELSAADVETDMPKVGKTQHAVEVGDDDAQKKDPSRRHDDKRNGGGFSGYK